MCSKGKKDAGKHRYQNFINEYGSESDSSDMLGQVLAIKNDSNDAPLEYYVIVRQ